MANKSGKQVANISDKMIVINKKSQTKVADRVGVFVTKEMALELSVLISPSVRSSVRPFVPPSFSGFAVSVICC